MNKVRVPLAILKTVVKKWEDGMSISVKTEKGNTLRFRGVKSKITGNPLLEIEINPED
jgi:hypothetical protein